MKKLRAVSEKHFEVKLTCIRNISTMAVAPFTSVLEASNRAKALLTGGFRLEGDDATEGYQPVGGGI